MSRINEAEAAETLRLLKELGDLQAELENMQTPADAVAAEEQGS
jgi:hydrogenase expression/formation protein HypC